MFGSAHRKDSETQQAAAEHEQSEDEAAEMVELSRGLTARGGGRPLPRDVRARMESSFGADFSSVRVHEDGMAEQLGAEAFALGNDLHFAQGRFDPSSQEGRELLGHELAHVVQQGGRATDGPQGKGATLAGTAALEHEADVAGAKAARGEPAQVSGAGSGIQFKRHRPPSHRAFLDTARDTKAPQIADDRIAELKNRLGAKAELRFTNREDGNLVERLEKAAAGRVEQIGERDGATATQKTDVKALSLKIAQRSKAVSTAISHTATALVKDIVDGGTYRQVFLDAATAAFNKTKVPHVMISQQAVTNQAIAAARLAARSHDEAEYQRAKTALDTKLADPTQMTALERTLTSKSRLEVETRAKEATKKRGTVDTKVTTIADEAKQPFVTRLHDEVDKYLLGAIGAHGAGWWRSSDLRTFRKKLKTKARHQAKQDVDSNLGSIGGEATRRFVGSDAKIRAYDEAKGSVNAQLEVAARGGTNDVFTAEKVDELITAAARQAAFAVYENDGHMPAAKAAALTAAKVETAALHDKVLDAAEKWKNALIKGMDQHDVDQRTKLGNDVVAKVTTDQVGKRSVEASLKANGPEDGMSALGSFFDFMLPERGDAIKFKVTLEVPAGPGNIMLEFLGEAERGGRERILKKVTPPGGGPKTTQVERDTNSLKLSAELKVGYSGSLPGVKLHGALGFFLRSDAASTDKCLKGLSYGIYRFLSGAIPPLANLWGGDHHKALKMSNTDPNAPDTDLQDDVYRSELWAAMIEEQVFKDDKEARVDLGIALSAGAELNAGVAKAKGGVRFEGMRTYDHQALKRSARRYNTKHHPGTTVGPKVGDHTFDKAGAEERRKALKGRTTGAFKLETELELELMGQPIVLGLKTKIAPPDFELEISGGLKLTTSDPAQAQTRLIAGIASASQNGIKMIVGMIRNIIDQDHPAAGALGDVVDTLTRTAGDINNIANNQFGDHLTTAYQLEKGTSDQTNETANTQLQKLFGEKPNTDEVPETNTKAGAVQESTYKVSIVIGWPFKLIIKVDEVQTTKVGVGGPTGPGLNIEYEKSRRVGQFGISQGRFHGELFGVSTKT